MDGRIFAGGIKGYVNSIEDCLHEAQATNSKCFGIGSHTECWYGNCERIDVNGESDGCINGRGGNWLVSVYKVTSQNQNSECTQKHMKLLWNHWRLAIECAWDFKRGSLGKCPPKCRQAFNLLHNIWKICQNADTISSVERWRFELVEQLGEKCPS